MSKSEAKRQHESEHPELRGVRQSVVGLAHDEVSSVIESTFPLVATSRLAETVDAPVDNVYDLASRIASRAVQGGLNDVGSLDLAAQDLAIPAEEISDVFPEAS